jgi:hypothetical protein
MLDKGSAASINADTAKGSAKSTLNAAARKNSRDRLINATSVDADTAEGSGRITRKNPLVSAVFYSINADVANGTGGELA